MDLRRLMDTIRNPSRTRVVFPMLLALAAGSLLAADAAPHKQSAPLTYSAVSDLAEHPKPALPDTGPGSASWTVNTIYKDPIFGTRIGRVTDGNTLVGASSDYRSYSFQTTASAEQNTWNTSGTKFYVDTMSGWIVPFAFDPVSMKASRIPDSGSRFGGLVLTGLRGEPAFSFTNPDWIYGVAPTPAGNAIIRYDFAANTYTNLLVVDSLCGGGPRLGAISVSATEVAPRRGPPPHNESTTSRLV